MRLYVKIAASIILILLVSTGLLAVFNFLKFEKTLGGLVNSQIYVLGDDLQGTIESGLSLGLPLPALQDTQEVIERAKQKNPRLRGVTVFELIGNEGTVVFDTQRERIGRPVAAEWSRAVQLGPKDAWRSETRDSFTVGLPVVNSFNKAVGAVVLDYDRAAFIGLLDATRVELGKYWLLILLPSAVVTVLGSFWLFRSLSHSMDRMTAAAPDGGAPASALEAEHAEFTARAAAALAEVEQLERDVEAAMAAGRA